MNTRLDTPAARLRRALGVLALTLAPAVAAHAAPAPAPAELHMMAQHTPYAQQDMVLGAWQSGPHVVTVGQHGVVLLSSDGGQHFKQAAGVPTSAALSDVTFIGQQGWAVGQWRVIVHSSDGGQHWGLQYSDPRQDRSLFGVHFVNSKVGFAVGLWSLLLSTTDGGRSWQQVKVAEPKGMRVSGPSLYHMFAAPGGTLFISAERGYVLRSTDQGVTWSVIDTGYHGSLWTGCSTSSGRIVVGGLRGTILFSDDDGQTWRHAMTGTKNSITDLVCNPRGIVATSVGGDLLLSRDGGASFTSLQSSDDQTYTAATLYRNSIRPYGIGGALPMVNIPVEGAVPAGLSSQPGAASGDSSAQANSTNRP